MAVLKKLFWRTEKRKVSELKLFPNNPRKMSQEQAQHLIDSIKKFNLVEIPVVDQNNRVLAGNMRIQALKTLNRGDDIIEVRVPSRPLTERECQEYLLRSNKNVGSWDYDLLANFDLDLLESAGFDNYDLKQIFGDIKNISPDENSLPETPEKTKIKSGDIIQLGRHTLMCADATVEENVKTLTRNTKISMILIDPEYNMDISKIYYLFHMFKCPIFVMCGDKQAVEIAYQFKKYFRMFFVLYFQAPVKLSQYVPLKHCTLIAYFNTGMDRNINLKGCSDIIEVPHRYDMSIQKYHGKVVDIPEYFIRFFSKKNDAVLDTFGGTGSTLIACENTDRTCKMMEIDPIRCEFICQRWEAFTGKRRKIL